VLASLFNSRDSSAGTAPGYELDGRSSISAEGRGFSILQELQTGSAAHLDSYPMGTGGSFSGTKRTVREAGHLPPSIAEVKNGGAIPPLPIRLHGQLPLILKKITVRLCGHHAALCPPPL
jgi:hypothetical protein